MDKSTYQTMVDPSESSSSRTIFFFNQGLFYIIQKGVVVEKEIMLKFRKLVIQIESGKIAL